MLPRIVLYLVLPGLLGQASADDVELERHMATLKRQIEDSSLEVERREGVALEMAATLDRAAQAETVPDRRQSHWARAIELLDEFGRKNLEHPGDREFKLQAAVYRWAQAESWLRQDQLAPANLSHRQQATKALDDAIERLRPIASDQIGEVISDNVRYRLARSLADRAELEGAGSPKRNRLESEAFAFVEKPVSEPGLKGHAELLKAELLGRLGRFEDAEKAAAAAAVVERPPSAREQVEVLVGLLVSRRKFAEAVSKLEGSPLSDAEKSLALVRVRLAELAQKTKDGPGAGGDRLPVELELFRHLVALRKTSSPLARPAFAELARSGLEPDPRNGPEAWDLMAEGWDVLAEPVKAAEREERAADRASVLGRNGEAGNFRLRSGGFLFQAGKYAESDAILGRVVDDASSGPARIKAGMLSALARGRGLALGLPGFTEARYSEALERQIREFPKELVTSEARWLLGTLVRATGDERRARSIWSEIPRDAPRWLDARLGIAGLMLSDLELRLSTARRSELTQELQQARTFLDDSLKQAEDGSAQAELSLALARLLLTPVVGKPAIARELIERVERLGLTPIQHYRTRLLRMIAQIQLARYVEAERDAHTHATWAEPSGRAFLIETVRLLDGCASNAELDLPQRRFGLVMRLLLQPMVATRDDQTMGVDLRAELTIRMTRALLFLGDDRGARFSLGSWTGPPRSANDRMLRDLADTYSRLEAYPLAIDVQRLRLKNIPSGSPNWFETRYELALAYYRSGQGKQATQLIDATAILHPDLGGGTLQQKYIALRQRLGTSR